MTAPRPLLAGAYAGSAFFAAVVAVATSNGLHRIWALFAACSYLLAAVSVCAWRARGVDLALAAALGGALAAPLTLLTAQRLQQPEVKVVERSAALLLRRGTPYPGMSTLAAAHTPNAFNPYLPLMSAFGLPRALLGNSALTDPRVWLAVAAGGLFAAALTVAGACDVGRWTALVVASPVVGLPLTVGGTDVPVLACLCLGLALLWRERPAAAGVALGVASAMKATAWPALAVAAVLAAAREGKGAALRMIGVAAGVSLAAVAPVAARWPGSFAQNTIAFPLGLTRLRSQAASPLPGRLLADTGHAGQLAAVTLLAVTALGLLAWLLVKPPRTVPSAVWRLVIGLTLIFMVAPATRFGYLAYPLGLLLWLEISRRGRARRTLRDVGGSDAPGLVPLAER